MMDRIKRFAARFWAIPALCYAVCLVIWLAGSIWGLAADTTARSSGRLAPFAMEAGEFELVNMELQPDGTLYTLTDDPQMLWTNPDGRALRTVRITADYDESAREMCLYYTNAPDEPFSQDKRVFAAQSNDGSSYLYTLPQGNIASLRLDPCSVKECTITVEGIAVNEDVPLWKYFAPGWHQGFLMVLYAGLASAGLAAVGQIVSGIRGGKKAPKPGK